MSATPIHFNALPAVGAPFEGGKFVGIATQPDGTHCAVALLPDQGGDLNHSQAVAWAEGLGGTLPTRPVAALLFANVKTLLRPRWHWLQETEGASYAWYCHFGDGNQNFNRKSDEGSAVAVRCIPLVAPISTTFTGYNRRQRFVNKDETQNRIFFARMG